MQSTPMRSWSQRLRSARNQLSLRIANSIRYSRGVHVESACGQLPTLTAAQQLRVTDLRQRYGIAFESMLSEPTSLNNYAYLDFLDRAWSAAQVPPPQDRIMVDVGCASFWYAAALQTFFRPRRLTGYDLEAHRRYANGHTRQDYACGYAASWPQTHFLAQDYSQVSEPAELVSCWFPFVSPNPILAWGLPLNLLKPKELFSRISANLSAGGGLFMVNHGLEEANIAAPWCQLAGLRRGWQWIDPQPLLSRPQPPVASYWQH